MAIQKVGIVGTGQMGLGIAQHLAQRGIETVAIKATGGDTSGKRAQVEKALNKLVEKDKLSTDDRDATLARLQVETDLGTLADCDLVIESIVEEMPRKVELFRELDGIVKAGGIFGSNTSTLGITEMANAVERKDRVFGLHFFNPATMMKLVEVVPTLHTDAATEAELVAFVEQIGKTPVVVRDETGFIVNRLLTPYMIDAIRTFERGLSGIVEIDTAMKLGTAHPMGPFELADYIGLDIVQHMAENLYATWREPRLAPPPLLNRLVLAGQLGRKSGLGFYDYSERPAKPRELR